jgi:hypothetical protein
MNPPDPPYLFGQQELRSRIEREKHELLGEIDAMAEDYVLSVDAEKLVEYLFQEHALKAPWLSQELPEIIERREITLAGDAYFRIPGGRVSATEIVFSMRVNADDLVVFQLAPSSRSSILPHGVVRNGELIFSLVSLGETPEQIRAEADRNVATIRQYLSWIAADFERFNRDIKSVATQRVESRRQRIKNDQALVEGVGYPVRRRSDEVTSYALPSARRKVLPQLPAAGSTAQPEPFLELTDYDDILDTLRHMATVMERSPSAFAGLEEEAIRWLFLIPLNGLYEGQATGETFNFTGKTDILIRVSGKNIFVAECAIWRGPAYFSEKIDQLLGYASWRDSKLALIIFNKGRQLTKILASISEVLKRHHNFKQELPQRSETEFRCVVTHRDDPQRELMLTICAFEVPA